jgi:hypothetical protein
MFSIFYIIALAILPFLFITYRIKNRFLFWALILLPPFFICPLALIPIRNPVILRVVWLPVLPFLLFSIIALIARIIRILLNSSDRTLKIRLVRPVLTIALFMFVFSYHAVSNNMAGTYAIDLAKEIQAECASDGLSPASMENWNEMYGILGDPNYFLTTVKRLGVPYIYVYRTSKDLKKFTVTVLHGFNMGTRIQGGVDKPLKAFHLDTDGMYEISLPPAKAQRRQVIIPVDSSR